MIALQRVLAINLFFVQYRGATHPNYAKPSPSDPAGRFSKVQRGDFEKSEDSSGTAK